MGVWSVLLIVKVFTIFLLVLALAMAKSMAQTHSYPKEHDQPHIDELAFSKLTV